MKRQCVIILLVITVIALIMPSALRGDEKDNSYKVSVGDVLTISVYQEDDLGGEFEVKDNGSISYPLLGQLQVAGLTKIAIENKLTQALAADYVVNPYVQVNIKKYHDRNIMLLGCVQKPGSYSSPEDKRITLLQAVSMAGGFTGYANIGGTKIVRTTTDNKKVVIDPRTNDIINGRRKDLDLEPNDLIIVPERLF